MEDSRRKEMIELLGPHKNYFLFFCHEVLKDFSHRPILTPGGIFFTNQLHYQIIGADAVAFITGANVPSPDIDIEIAPIMDLEGKTVNFFIPRPDIPAAAHELPLVTHTVYKGRNAVRSDTYEVHPAYFIYMTYLRNSVFSKLTSLIKVNSDIQALNSQISPVDPSQDLETSKESPQLSGNVGNFHVSFIVNPNFISKIQITINYKGKIEHIVEFIIYKAKHSHFFPMLGPIYPAPLLVNIGTNVTLLVANPYDALKQNIEAVSHRIWKRGAVVALLERGEATPEDLAHISTKLFNTLDRIGLLLNSFKEKKGDTIVIDAVSYMLDSCLRYELDVELRNRMCSVFGNYPDLLEKGEFSSFCKATAGQTKTVVHEAFGEAVSSKPAPETKTVVHEAFGEAVSSKPAPETKTVVHEAFGEAVSSKAAPSTVSIQTSAPNLGFTLVKSKKGKKAAPKPQAQPSPQKRELFDFGDEDDEESAPVKETVQQAPPKKEEYTEPPMEEDLDSLLKSHRAIVGGQLLPIDYYLIKEPLAMLKSFETRPTSRITLKNKYTLFSILDFIGNMGTDFIFVYTLPSIHTGLYYYQNETYQENIVYEEPSLHHIFKLYELYIRLKMLTDEVNRQFQRKGIREKEAIKKENLRTRYNTILIIIGQIQLRGLLPEADIRAFQEKFTVEYMKKGHTDELIPELIKEILSIDAKMLFHLTQKHRLAELFKIANVAAMLEHIKNPEDFYFKFNTLRAAFLNRQIEQKKETHAGNVYLFCPYNTLVSDDKDMAARDSYEKLFYDAINESSFTPLPFPNTSFTHLNQLMHTDIYDNPRANHFCMEYNANMFHAMIDIFNDMMDVIEGGGETTDEYVATLIKKTLTIKDKDGEPLVMKRPDNLPELVKILFEGTKYILLNDTQPITVTGETQMTAPILQSLFLNIYQDIDNAAKIKNIKFLLSKVEIAAYHNMGMSDILDRHSEFVNSLIQEETVKHRMGELSGPEILSLLTQQFNGAIQIDEFMAFIDTPNTAPIDMAFMPRPTLWKVDPPTPTPVAASGAGGGGSKPPPRINNLDRKSRKTRRERKSNRRKTRRSGPKV